ncbi:magnesium transporter CorA family protein [uncultured Dubosiella sp.]|uniref:magnesium transporter CorA family protein n=1 Tax=uncultured Dubosiella sp. TaxID=1937011 RepID=UPI0025B2977C|nr:magnesium transporter CorA family protein [uncultured Dubosiella sp.]
MLEFYKTNEQGVTAKIESPEPGCWVSAIAPTYEERNYLIEKIGVLPEFVKSSLDEEESAHIDYDDDVDQTLVIFDYPNMNEEEDPINRPQKEKELTLQYMTLPLGVVILKGYIVTISLYENNNVNDLASGRVKGLDTKLKTRFLLLLLLRISQRYLIYLRQIDRLSSRTEKKLYQTPDNKELIDMLGLEKSLVYFSTSLKSDELTLSKIMRGRQIKLYEDDEDLLEDVMIEIKQAVEMCSIYSGILSSTMDTFANVISNNLNFIMQILTVITIVMAIPNMIFGFYGMNVKDLLFPFAWFPLLLAVIACVCAIFIFKKKDMFH